MNEASKFLEGKTVHSAIQDDGALTIVLTDGSRMVVSRELQGPPGCLAYGLKYRFYGVTGKLLKKVRRRRP